MKFRDKKKAGESNENGTDNYESCRRGNGLFNPAQLGQKIGYGFGNSAETSKVLGEEWKDKIDNMGKIVANGEIDPKPDPI